MNNVTFDAKDFDNYGKYGFVKVDENSILFSIKKLGIEGKHRRFLESNFSDVSKCYYKAMEFDSGAVATRRRKLSNFLKSVYDQNDMDVCLLMIKSASYYIDQGLDEYDIISRILKSVLPGAGYSKRLNGEGRYIWEIDDRKKFNRGIGKAFVLTYINNKFDKDATWAYVKKHCYLKDGIWNYKTDRSRTIIEKTFLNYFRHGGIIVKEMNLTEPKEFKAFIPFNKIYDEEGNAWDSLEKEVKKSSHPVIQGIASTANVDRDYERVSKNFIDKMQKTGKGLPILDNTHYASKAMDTIGVVVDTGGDEETFKVKVRLMKPEDSSQVDYILKQMKTGITYGFSVGGRITKVFREFREDIGKEVYVLDDGELFHIALTTQPANSDTLSVAMSKSLDLKKVSVKRDTEYKHSSRLAKSEPAIEDIDVEKLPEIAFPSNSSRTEVYKDYPHHFINDKGMLFLHEGMALKSYAKAVQDKAPESVLNHFATHLQCIGLGKKISEFKAIAESIDSMGEVKQVADNLEKELVSFFVTVNTVGNLQNSTEDKMKILSKIISDMSTKISNILEPITEKEESNES